MCRTTNKTCLFVVLTFASSFAPSFASLRAADDWPVWRGPNRNGIANSQQPPTTWNANTNIVWQATVPGRGHSSPIVVGNNVLLTTAIQETQDQQVLCFDRATGKPRWQASVNQGGFLKKIHSKNTHATPTLLSDGKHVFATFCNHESVQLAAFDLNGRKLWSVKAGSYTPKAYHFGFAPTPALYGQSIIVAAEFENRGYLAAFDTATGKEKWRTARPPQISYSSPVVARTGGRDQLLLSGCQAVSSYDPQKGSLLWTCPGTSNATCGTMVWSEDTVFASGGYPDKETLAVRSNGSAQPLWRNKEKCYEQSMLYHDGFLYAMNDNGIAICWNAATGEEMWKQRLGGPVSASPILAGGNIYAANERGTMFVFKANPSAFTGVAKNQLGTEGFATAAFCGNQIFLRTADTQSGKRVETLYCIGE